MLYSGVSRARLHQIAIALSGASILPQPLEEGPLTASAKYGGNTTSFRATARMRCRWQSASCVVWSTSARDALPCRYRATGLTKSEESCCELLVELRQEDAEACGQGNGIRGA
jgi:hypothetical protein